MKKVKRTGWEEPKILQTETNSRYRKLHELTLMACAANLINQLTLELLTTWFLLNNKEINKKS
jgi:hypothetical protein